MKIKLVLLKILKNWAIEFKMNFRSSAEACILVSALVFSTNSKFHKLISVLSHRVSNLSSHAA